MLNGGKGMHRTEMILEGYEDVRYFIKVKRNEQRWERKKTSEE
jgi:O-phosphoseryl-tRNA(Cys) synthetase